MAKNNNNNKNGKALRMAKFITGVRKNFQNGNQPIALEGASTTIDGAVGELQKFIDAREAIVAAQAGVTQKVAVEDAGMAAVDVFFEAFITFVRNTLGSQAAALADFGIPARKKPAPLSAAEKAVAAAKRAATRKARGTTGKKAKQAVHGNITAQLVVTPAPAVVSEPAAPAASPAQPAQAPAPQGTTPTAPKA